MTDDYSEQLRRRRERSEVAAAARAEPSRDASPLRAPEVASISLPAVAPGKLGIEPVANPNNDSSLSFDWRVVDIDANRSFGCTIASRLGHDATVEIEQGL